MKIIIYSQNLVSMDGVGNSVLYFKNLLKNFAEIEIISHHSNIKGVINFNKYLQSHQENNILLYHYSIYDVNLKLLLELNFKKRIIYYHGITYPDFFEKDSDLYKNCKRGLSEINLLDKFDLYISNSSQSHNQFLKNVNKRNLEINHIVMPPIELFKSKLPVLKDKLDKSILNFYYCGTLSNHKNVKSMIELFKNSKNYDLQLSIITSFSKNDAMGYLGEEKYYEFSNNGMRFFHRLNNLDMAKLIKKMNCFITFSLHEGFCIPLFNSIENSIATITYPLACLKDYFPADYKFLTKDDSIENIVDKYYYNFENIKKSKEFIKEKCTYYSRTGLDLILKEIDIS